MKNAEEQVTYAIVKPGVFETIFVVCLSLCEMATRDNVSFSDCGKVFLTEDEVARLYEGVPHSVMEATIKHMANKQMSVFQIRGKDVIAKIAALRGSNVDPAMCKQGTWRAEMHKKHPLHPRHLSGGFLYWNNYVHAPKNEFEAGVCHGLLEKYFRK